MSGLYRKALLAYPVDYRQQYGAEIADSAAELASSDRSIPQAFSMAVAGLRVRGDRAADKGVKSMFDSCLRLHVFLGHVVFAAIYLTSQLQPNSWNVGLYSYEVPFWPLLPTLAVLATATFTTRWPAAALAVMAIIANFIASPFEGPGDRTEIEPWFLWTTALHLLPIFYLAIRGDGRRACSPRAGLLTLSLLLGIGLTSSHAISAIAVTSALLGLLGVSLMGIVLITIDTRPLLLGLISISLQVLWTAPLTVRWTEGELLSTITQVLAMVAFTTVSLGLATFSIRHTSPARR